jgi:Zn-dependent M28 family amino/carboxypeptidase
MLVSAETASRRGLYSGTLAGPGIRIPVVIASTRALGDVADGAEVAVNVDADSEERTTENVIAETPGGTPEHVVMAGGHLDSVRGGPGINDNGSGVAALIELAEAVGAEPPGARVRLAFWGAEELGLVGSRHYVESLDRAERRLIRGYLNFDMVGSPNAVPEVYVDGNPALARLLRRVTPGRLGSASAGTGSDHAPFKAAGLAIGGLYTGGPEPARGGRPRDPCYHLSCDTARNVDRSTLLRMARAAAESVEALSERHK